MNITKEIGYKIKFYRKNKKMTVDQLAAAVCKSKSCISKYESGSITIDIATLYDLARVLEIRVDQLLYFEPQNTRFGLSDSVPAFFRGLSQFYLYYFDGRTNKITRCVLDIRDDKDATVFPVMMYMNINNYQHYQICENIYLGHIYHYDSLSSLILQNQHMVMEHYQISIPHPYINAETKWGLAYGISSRPLMPTATKVLISKTIQEETPEFFQNLKLSKEDIRLMKLYNMLTVQ